MARFRAGNVPPAASGFSKLNRPSRSLSMVILGCSSAIFSIRTSFWSRGRKSIQILARFAMATSAPRLRMCVSSSVTSKPGKKATPKRPPTLTSIPNAPEAAASSRGLWALTSRKSSRAAAPRARSPMRAPRAKMMVRGNFDIGLTQADGNSTGFPSTGFRQVYPEWHPTVCLVMSAIFRNSRQESPRLAVSVMALYPSRTIGLGDLACHRVPSQRQRLSGFYSAGLRRVDNVGYVPQRTDVGQKIRIIRQRINCFKKRMNHEKAIADLELGGDRFDRLLCRAPQRP